MRKFLFLVGDGMGDWPLDELGGKTVLQAARTPAMDALARSGIVGRCRTVPQGMPPGSDVANMALMGFDPATMHTGRGPIEAAAQGIELGPDDLVWRCNLVDLTSLDADGTMLDYSAGHIDTREARLLILDLVQEMGTEPFELVPGVQYRHLLIHWGGAASEEARLAISPPHDILDQPIRADVERYASCPLFWDFLLRAAHRLQRRENTTRARALWPWGQGRALHLPDFTETFGLRGGVISAVDLIKGLGRAAGMEVLDVAGATGLLDTDYEGKVQAALDFLQQGDFVFVHVEAPDECGHGGNVKDKIEAIERFDARIVRPLVQALPEAGVLLACDHFTPIVERTHVSDPVPFALCWPGCTPNGAQAYDEANALATGLLLEPGHSLLPWCLERLKG